VIRHVALLTFADGTTDAQVQSIAEALSTLPALIPQLVSYAIGPDLGLNEANASFAVVADCRSVEDYGLYRDHPEHRRIIAELIAPALAGRTGLQYEIPDAANG
jgi:hypothetical protein